MIRTVVMHLLPLLDNLINALENELCQCTSSQNIDGNYVAGKLMKLRPRFGEISEKSALRVLKPKIFTAFGLFQTVWRILMHFFKQHFQLCNQGIICEVSAYNKYNETSKG